MPWALVRAIPAIRHDPLGYLATQVAEHGDLVSFPLPRTPVLLVNDPAAARRVLQENHRGYGKQTVQYTSLATVTGSGMIVAEGPEWRRRRRLAQPAFHHGELTEVAAQTVAAADAMAAEWAGRPGGVADVDAATVRMSLRVVGRTLFDDDLAASGEQLVDAVAQALQAVVARARTPLPATQLRSRARLRRAVGVIDATTTDLIARRRARGLGPEDGDLLALLLRSGQQDADGLDDRQVRDELVSLVIAGHETVASGLTWALWLLADDARRGGAGVQALARVQAELDRVLGGPDGRDPVWADLPELAFTRAVVDETLRLYPPVWLITRRATADDVLGGVPVPAGSLLILSPWLLHRRPGAWADPDRFDPGRFAEGGVERLGRSGDYLPFGAGPRLCIGRDFALVESVLVLATVLRRYTVEVPDGVRSPQVEAAVTLRPRTPLELRLRPRAVDSGGTGHG
jgi:cytochrome P450